jgi:hypothetical protein
MSTRNVEESLHIVTQALTERRDKLPPMDIREMFHLEALKRLGAFTPHPETESVIEMTVDWVKKLGFLTPRNADQIRAWATMTTYAHPKGERSILNLDAYVYGAIYLMDDWLANDAQNIQLTPEQRQVLKEFVGVAIRSLQQAENGKELEQITADFQSLVPDTGTPEMIEFFHKTALLFDECWRLVLAVKNQTDPEFARGYAQALRQHLTAGLTNQDDSMLEGLDLDRYLDIRIEVAGMKVGRELVKMTTESHRGLRALHASATAQPTPANTSVQRLIMEMEKDTDDFGCIGNDVFSIIKEVFRDKTIFNFIAIAILSQSETQDSSALDSLALSEEALRVTQERIHKISESFVNRYLGDNNGSPSFAAEVDQLTESDLVAAEGLTVDQIKEQLNAYVQGLVQYFLATYYWELDPEGGLLRYQRPEAIFEQLLSRSLLV